MLALIRFADTFSRFPVPNFFLIPRIYNPPPQHHPNISSPRLLPTQKTPYMNLSKPSGFNVGFYGITSS